MENGKRLLVLRNWDVSVRHATTGDTVIHLVRGHTDALKCRTLKMYKVFGFVLPDCCNKPSTVLFYGAALHGIKWYRM